MALGGMSKDVLQLNKAMSLAATRLHEIVVLKNTLEKVEHEKKYLESLYEKDQKERTRQRDDKAVHLAMANRALRAEAMAGWMEQQLLAVGGAGVEIDYTYHPEIQVSKTLELVLKKDDWLLSGDDIAKGWNEQDLAMLAGDS